MSKIQVDTIVDKLDTGGPFFPRGINIGSVGIATTGTGINVGSVGIVSTGITVGSVGITTTGINTDQLSNANLINYSEKVSALGNTGSSKNINIQDGNYITATLNQSTTFTFTSPASGKVYGFSLFLTNGSGGPFTITWPISIKWPNNTTPVRTTADGKSDIWVFTTIDGGTTWYGYIGIYNFS